MSPYYISFTLNPRISDVMHPGSAVNTMTPVTLNVCPVKVTTLAGVPMCGWNAWMDNVQRTDVQDVQPGIKETRDAKALMGK